MLQPHVDYDARHSEFSYYSNYFLQLWTFNKVRTKVTVAKYDTPVLQLSLSSQTPLPLLWHWLMSGLWHWLISDRSPGFTPMLCLNSPSWISFLGILFICPDFNIFYLASVIRCNVEKECRENRQQEEACLDLRHTPSSHARLFHPPAFPIDGLVDNVTKNYVCTSMGENVLDTMYCFDFMLMLIWLKFAS